MCVPHSAPRDHGWYVDELVSTLTVSTTGLRLLERWRVVATDPCDELLVELNVDATGHDAWFAAAPVAMPAAYDVQVIGGELTEDEWPLSVAGRPMLCIRLPRVLEPGEPHELDLCLWLGLSRPVGRHVHLPAVPCRRLRLRVRFDQPEPPTQVSGIVGTAATGVVQTPVDRFGDVALAVRDAVPGLLYGITWDEGTAVLGDPWPVRAGWPALGLLPSILAATTPNAHTLLARTTSRLGYALTPPPRDH